MRYVVKSVTTNALFRIQNYWIIIKKQLLVHDKNKNIVLTCWFSGYYICKRPWFFVALRYITSTLFPTKDFDQQQRESAAFPTTSSLSPRWEIYPFREKSNQKFYLPIIIRANRNKPASPFLFQRMPSLGGFQPNTIVSSLVESHIFSNLILQCGNISFPSPNQKIQPHSADSRKMSNFTPANRNSTT